MTDREFAIKVATKLWGLDEDAIKCPHDPRKTQGAIGMYHCPNCGAMVLAGMPHDDKDAIAQCIETYIEFLVYSWEGCGRTIEAMAQQQLMPSIEVVRLGSDGGVVNFVSFVKLGYPAKQFHPFQASEAREIPRRIHEAAIWVVENA